MSRVIPFKKGAITAIENCEPGIVMHLDGSLWKLNGDGTEEALGDGGSQPTYESRALYSGSPVVVTDGSPSLTFLTWDLLGSGAELLDLDDQTVFGPRVFAGGIYEVTANVQCMALLTAGAAFEVVLHLDFENEDSIGKQNGGSGIQAPELLAAVSVSNTYYIPPGGVVGVSVLLEDGAADRSFRLTEATLQLIPGGP